jgi:uncharacterized membrane protein
MDGFLFVLTLVTALGCGLNAGVFFTFSSFVMQALARLPAAQGIAAMQSINERAVTPVFMTALFGTGAACMGLAVWSLFLWHEPFAVYLLGGSALYVVGTVGVTMVRNVPLNDRLAALHAEDAGAAGHWDAFVARWTAWNHVRTVAALAAAAALTVALHV